MLLRRGLDVADGKRLDVYLKTAERTIGFYEKSGFDFARYVPFLSVDIGSDDSGEMERLVVSFSVIISKVAC